MPPTDQAFLREVDEAVRQDELLGFWRRYGRWIALAVLVALLAFAATLYWRHHRAQTSSQVSESVSTVLQFVGAGRQPDAKSLAALENASAPGYAALAQLAKAAAAVNKGDTKGAAAIYGKIASDESLDQPWRDLALVRQTALEFDSLPPAQVVERMKPLAVAGEPWFASAAEMTAIAYMKQGKANLAGPLFAAIAKDEQAPPSLRERSQQMAGALGVDGAEAKQ